MDLVVFKSEQLQPALRALWVVANANGSVTPEEHQFFSTLAELHHQPVPELGAIGFDEVAEAIPDAHARHRLTQLAVVTAMIDQDPTHAQSDTVNALASALGQEERGLKLLRDLAAHRRLLVRLDAMRRMLAGRFMGDSALEKLGRFKDVLAAVTGIARFDGERSMKFRKLGLLPEGTLGREFFKFTVSRGFFFPGDNAAGVIEETVFHDFGHVLAGYDSTEDGEIRQGSFQAGNRRDDGFVFLCFVIAQFHLGYAIMPAVARPLKGRFNVPAVLEAVSRGAACKVDLTDHWDFWPHVERRVHDLREEFGIPPIRHVHEGVQPGYTP